VNTVSQSYMNELRTSANGLENLFEFEKGKCTGVLNGIDNDVWNPETDEHLEKNYSAENVDKGKRKNKKAICKEFNLDPEKPLFTFIGRLVGEKAADILPEAISSAVYNHQGNCSFVILGSGDKAVEAKLESVKHQLTGYVNTYIGYSEPLSHMLYAGADFLLMPSRVEPCGLNQLYALRYGTIPIVRSTGGLIDTVKDFGEPGGFGIHFDNATVWDISYSIGRAIDLYKNKDEQFEQMRKIIMGIDHSWENSAQQYISLYESVK